MTMRQFDALAKRRKLDNDWQDYRSAQIVAILANINRDPKKRREPFTPFDFMPGKQKPKKKQTVEEQLEIVRMLNAAFGGKEQ